MLLLVGKILAVTPDKSTNRETGEVAEFASISILTTENGKPKIENLKADLSVMDAWKKAIDKEVRSLVRVWSANGKFGFFLADKKSLPVLAA
jgi:methionyl-tRNA formyltransferase